MIQIGDVFPWEPAQGILGPELAAPQWYILRTVSQKEKGAAAKLEKQGVPETWYPAEEAWRIQRNAKRDRVAYERLIAPGYLFALFDRAPVWHRISAQMKGYVTGVVGVEDRPYAVPESVLAQMRLVPKRIELLRQEETARDKAARLAREPAAGQRAQLTEGPFAGMVVDIERIDRGIAAFLLAGIKGSASLHTMVRVDASGKPV